MIYQDYLKLWRGDAATALFELANLPKVAYRCRNGAQVVVKQDRDIKDCTGGIVWETAYLLATFLEEQLLHSEEPAGRPKSVLEVGAGCGLLGLVLAAAGCQVVLTETTEAIPNLQTNVSANKLAGGNPKGRRPAAMQLSWDRPEDRRACLKASGGPFDVIVGTDVVFAERLVEPLLATLHALSDHTTVIWLCLQERCPEAHSALLRLTPEYFTLEDASASLSAAPGCSHAADLDCVLLRLSRRKGAVEEPRKHADTADGTEAGSLPVEVPIDSGSGEGIDVARGGGGATEKGGIRGDKEEDKGRNEKEKKRKRRKESIDLRPRADHMPAGGS